MLEVHQSPITAFSELILPNSGYTPCKFQLCEKQEVPTLFFTKILVFRGTKKTKVIGNVVTCTTFQEHICKQMLKYGWCDTQYYQGTSYINIIYWKTRLPTSTVSLHLAGVRTHCFPQFMGGLETWCGCMEPGMTNLSFHSPFIS